MTTKASDQKHNGQGADLSADNELPGLCRELLEIRARQKADKLRGAEIADRLRQKLGPDHWYAFVPEWEIFHIEYNRREYYVPAGTHSSIQVKRRN